MRCTQTRNPVNYFEKLQNECFQRHLYIKDPLMFSHSSINRDSSFVFQRISHNFGFDPSFNVKSKCKFDYSSLVLVLLVEVL